VIDHADDEPNTDDEPTHTGGIPVMADMIPVAYATQVAPTATSDGYLTMDRAVAQTDAPVLVDARSGALVSASACAEVVVTASETCETTGAPSLGQVEHLLVEGALRAGYHVRILPPLGSLESPMPGVRHLPAESDCEPRFTIRGECDLSTPARRLAAARACLVAIADAPSTHGHAGPEACVAFMAGAARDLLRLLKGTP